MTHHHQQHQQQQHQQHHHQQPTTIPTMPGSSLPATQQTNVANAAAAAANAAAVAALTLGQQHPLEVGKKRAADTDMFQLVFYDLFLYFPLFFFF